ncbi:MAG: Hint domain-containing protein, partial [Phycisphaerales bacterium]
FLVDGGEASGAWVQAASLKPGDEVRTATGEPAVVVAVRFTGRTATVYNLEVDGLHTYRVGRDGIVVHNNMCNLWEWGMNMADHVLQPKHNWDQVFGGAKPSWSQVQALLGKAASEGVEGMPQAIYNSAGKQIGVQLEKIITVNGREVVAKLSNMDAMGKWILKDGWVR